MTNLPHTSRALLTNATLAAHTRRSSIDAIFSDVVVPLYKLLFGILKHLWIISLLKYMARWLSPRRLRDWWASELVGSRVIAKLKDISQWIESFSEMPKIAVRATDNNMCRH